MKSITCKLFLFVLFCGLSVQTMGQSGKLAKANKFFKELNYQKAIQLYEKVLSKEVVPEALFKLPECYRKIGNYRKAEYWYSQAVMHPEHQPEHHFYLGLCKLANKNPVEARASFEQFVSLAPGDTRGPRLLEACKDSIRDILLGTGALISVRNVKEINTRFDEFSVARHRKGIVYCADRDTSDASRKLTSAWTGRPFVDVYYVDSRLVDDEIMKYKYGTSRKFDRLVSTKYHDGPVAFSPDGTVMYYTQNYKGKNKDRDGNLRLKIMSVRMTNTGWERKGEPIDFARNDYSVMHPAITQYGDKMYFASDMPGGFGRMDIYVSYYEAGRWSEPINLGPEINTEGDEVFPWVDYDGKLYFASDGHTGLGGLDIYYTKAGKGTWEPVQNVGSPINSSKDDFAYMADSSGIFGYFSSSRDSSVGLTDIYSFRKLSLTAELLVFDKLTGKGIEGVNLTSDCFPRNDFDTNIEGRADLGLPLYRSCNFTLTSDKFPDTTITVSTKGYKIGDKLFIQVPIELTTLELTAQGQIKHDVTGEPIAGATIELLSNCASESKTITSDANGNYELSLKPNCQYLIKASKAGYFTTATSLNTIGAKEDKVFDAQIAMPELFTTGGFGSMDTSSLYQIEKVYFDYDSDRLDISRSSGLNELLRLMENNEDLAVEIRAHTDSRGPTEYNLALSNRRAQSIANYLIDQGISESRISYLGFGESQLVNNCDDFTTCSEFQHSMNRRTEFRVIKFNQ